MKLPESLPVIVRDVAGLIGAALVAYGAWLIYRPAGFIVAGIFLVVGSYLTARASVT
jgi:hypothetical protein